MPYILAGSNQCLLARGQGATNTFWSQDVNGKRATKKKGTENSMEKWYDLVLQTANP